MLGVLEKLGLESMRIYFRGHKPSIKQP